MTAAAATSAFNTSVDRPGSRRRTTHQKKHTLTISSTNQLLQTTLSNAEPFPTAFNLHPQHKHSLKRLARVQRQCDTSTPPRTSWFRCSIMADRLHRFRSCHHKNRPATTKYCDAEPAESIVSLQSVLQVTSRDPLSCQMDMQRRRKHSTTHLDTETN